jgi:hypothetical protein
MLASPPFSPIFFVDLWQLILVSMQPFPCKEYKTADFARLPSMQHARRREGGGTNEPRMLKGRRQTKTLRPLQAKQLLARMSGQKERKKI